MTAFTLKNDGYPTFKKIISGRTWIGSVRKLPEGGYRANIGTTVVTAAIESVAFNEVVAQHLGYSSAQALRARNSLVRRKNAANRAEANHAVNSALNGNFADFKRILDRM